MASNSSGIDFLLKGARDASGKPCAPSVTILHDRGARIFVCNNTFISRDISQDALVAPIAPIAIVESGAVELARLQVKDHFAYFKP